MAMSGWIKRRHRFRKTGFGCSCSCGADDGFDAEHGHRRRRFGRGGRFHHAAERYRSDRPLHHAPAALNQLVPGDAARVVEIDDGRGFRAKLLAMGLTPGCVVRCIRKNGPNVVCLRLEGQDTEIFINRMMAERIGVEPIAEEAEEQ